MKNLEDRTVFTEMRSLVVLGTAILLWIAVGSSLAELPRRHFLVMQHKGGKRDRVKVLVAKQSCFAIIFFLTFYLCIETYETKLFAVTKMHIALLFREVYSEKYSREVACSPLTICSFPWSPLLSHNSFGYSHFSPLFSKTCRPSSSQHVVWKVLHCIGKSTRGTKEGEEQGAMVEVIRKPDPWLSFKGNWISLQCILIS